MSVHLPAVFALERQPKARQHKPRGLLGDTKGAGQFVAADAVLAVGEQPERGQPLLEADSGILEDGADLQRELGFGVLLVALPDTRRFEVGDLLGAAPRAADSAIGPPDGLNGLPAIVVIREEQNRFAEGSRCGFGGHE